MSPLQLKFIAYAVVLAACVGLGFYIHHKGYASGVSVTQTAWDADKAAISKLAIEAQAKANADQSAAQLRNEVIINALKDQLATSESDGISLAERLRLHASFTTGSGPLPSVAGESAIVGPSGTPSDDESTKLLGAAFAECARNADRLDALIGEVNANHH